MPWRGFLSLHQGGTMLEKYSALINEAGCDEAGRGCLAGPVFAAAVIIPSGVQIIGLNDSKKLSEKQRLLLREEIQSKTIWSVAACSPHEIDQLNILWASVEAMHRALHGLTTTPEFVSVDGNKFKPWCDIPYKTHVKGDARFAHIAAASILAKTHRDDYMLAMSQLYPHYAWDKNKGYPTKTHRDAIASFGISPEHRRSFRQLPLQQVFGF
jgi:ribonuclease HII